MTEVLRDMTLPSMTHMEIRQTLSVLKDAFGLGPFTTQEAAARGVSSDRLRSAVRVEALQRLARGTYAIGPHPLDRARAAVERLDTMGIPAVVGERTAGALWGVPAVGAHAPLAEAPTTLLIPRDACDRVGVRIGTRSGVRMVAADLEPADVIDWCGIPVTRPLRTGLDIARRHGRSRSSALVPLCGGARMEIALRCDLVDMDTGGLPRHAAAITEEARSPLHRSDVSGNLKETALRLSAHGMRWVWQVLPDVEPLVETALEGLAWASMTDSGLPRPRPQEWVRGASGRWYRADFLIGGRIILEADGATKYVDQTPWQEKQRQSDLEAAGYWVVRCTWEELIHHPHLVLARIALALRRAA